MASEYYFEKINGAKCNFNLWEKEGDRYFNIATLFYQDPLCGTQWTIDEKARAVNYDSNEIQDEVENPLKQIPLDKAKVLLQLTSAHEVAKSIDDLLE